MARTSRPITITLDDLQELKEKVGEAFVDPGASVPARDVFRRLRAYHAEQTKAEAEV